MTKLNCQNGNFNLSVPYLDITEALEHQKTTYGFYVSAELIVIFEPFFEGGRTDILTTQYKAKSPLMMNS